MVRRRTLALAESASTSPTLARGSIGSARVWDEATRAALRGDPLGVAARDRGIATSLAPASSFAPLTSMAPTGSLDPTTCMAPSASMALLTTSIGATLLDERLARIVRDVVLETLQRHGLDPVHGAELAFELRARLLALLLLEPAAGARPFAERFPGQAATSAPPAPAAAPADAPPPPAVAHAPWTGPRDPHVEEALRERLRGLSVAHERWPELSELLIELAQRAGRDGADSADPLEDDAEIDTLRRRVKKLEMALEEARSTVTRVAGMEKLDPGLASIYRSVQGLLGTDPMREAKREMLELVYQANVVLQRKAG